MWPINQNPCQQCGGSMGRRSIWAKYCSDCIDQRNRESLERSRKRHPQPKGALRAHIAVREAIRKGLLPRPDSSLCVDCNFMRAKCYDHRDYNKPLDVQPVCYSCNVKRGKAIPHVDDVAKAAT